MKATAIDYVLRKLTNDPTFDGSIEIHTANRMFTLTGDLKNRGYSYKVDEDDNTLCLESEQGTQWIDCDYIISIEI